LLELAPASRLSGTGCCGFFGPVPPPLWISRSYLTNHHFSGLRSSFPSRRALNRLSSPPIFRVHGLSKDFAASAYFHLLEPTPLGFSPADRPIDEPAEVTQVKFPRRACLPDFRGTVPNDPAGTGFPGTPSPIGD
jgi:hypothetical protein